MTNWTRNSKTLFKLFRSIKFIYFTLLSYHVYIFVSLNRPPSRNVFWIDKKRLTNCWCRITLNCINNVFFTVVIHILNFQRIKLFQGNAMINLLHWTFTFCQAQVVFEKGCYKLTSSNELHWMKEHCRTTT